MSIRRDSCSVASASASSRRAWSTSRSTAPRVVVSDRIWTGVYVPASLLVHRLAQTVAWLQQGRISTYLIYSLVTLLVLLGFVL